MRRSLLTAPWFVPKIGKLAPTTNSSVSDLFVGNRANPVSLTSGPFSINKISFIPNQNISGSSSFNFWVVLYGGGNQSSATIRGVSSVITPPASTAGQLVTITFPTLTVAQSASITILKVGIQWGNTSPSPRMNTSGGSGMDYGTGTGGAAPTVNANLTFSGDTTIDLSLAGA